MNTTYATRILIIFLMIFILYGLFIFVKRIKKGDKPVVAIRHTLLLFTPLLLLFILVEIVFRILVSQPTMKAEAHFITRNFATAYYIKSIRYDKYKPRYIRLKEHKPFTNIKAQFRYEEKQQEEPYQLRTNADGFIIPECCESNKFIFFVGGSTTECLFVKESKRFPYLVAHSLHRSGLNYAIKNAGVSGNNTFHSIDILLNKILPYNPDVVVYMEAINDFTLLLYENGYHNTNPFRSLIVDDNKMQTTAHTLDEYYAKRGVAKRVDTAHLFKHYKKALKIFVSICKDADAKPVLMTQFNRIDSSCITSCKMLSELLAKYQKEFPQLEVINVYKTMNNIIRQVAMEENVQLIDLDRLIPKSQANMYDIVHLTTNGSVLAADIISNSLKPVLLPGNP